MVEKLKILIGSINLVGEEPKFKIQGYSRVPSACSILLSAIAIALIGSISYVFLAESFDVSKPDVNIELRTLPNYPKIPLGSEKMFFAVIRNNLTVGNSREEVDWATMGTITARVILKTFEKDKEGNASGRKFKRFFLKTVNCSQVMDRYQYLENHTMTKSISESGLCFVPKDAELTNYYLQGHRLEDIYSSFEINFWPCSLKNPKKCASENLVSRAKYVLVRPSPDIDLSKPDKFFKWIPLAGDLNEIDPGSRQQFYSKFKKFSIFDKTSIFEEAKHKKDYFQIDEYYVKSLSRDRTRLHCPARMIGNKALCQPYMEMIFTSSNKQESITRLYPSHLIALSEIGGFTELILMFIGFVYGLYNSRVCEMRTFLVKSVFALGKNGRLGASEEKGYGKVAEDNLDLIEVMKELNGLRILNKVIFKDYHLTLLPEVLSRIKAEESKQEQKKEKEKHLSQGKELAKRNSSDQKKLPKNKISPLDDGK